MLRIVTCIKVVTDPEAPASAFKIDPGGMRAVPGQGVPPVLNPYDENCLEAALRIKDSREASITVISLGTSVPKAVIKKSLAVGADELVVLEDPAFDTPGTSTTAAALAAAVRKLGDFDLILCGRMAADTNAGQVGIGLAQLLDIPCLTVARKIDVDGTAVRVERAQSDGYTVTETQLPCLVTVSHELGELRQANIKGLMAAQKQPFTTWHLDDLGEGTDGAGPLRLQKLFVPERDTVCEFVEGETPEELAAGLARTMRDNKLI